MNDWVFVRSAMYVALAGTCINKGLSLSQTERVWARMQTEVVPDSIADAYLKLLHSIEWVKNEPEAR